MDLNAVRLFVAVVQSGSLSKASEQLDVPIATISRQIKMLEQSLNMQLLDRLKTGIKPTTQGQLFYEQVYLNIDNLLNTERNLQQDKQSLTGTLRISTIIGSDHIWDLLIEFQQRYPEVQVYCQATDRVVDLVADGIDVAIRIGELHTDNVIATPIMDMQGIWVASPELLAHLGTPKTPQDLVNFPCASFGREGQKAVLFQWKNANGQVKSLEIPCSFLSNDNSAVAYLAKGGKAVCYMSAYTAKQLIEQGELVQILEDYPPTTSQVNAVYLSHRHQSAVVKAFIGFLKDFRRDRVYPCPDYVDFKDNYMNRTQYRKAHLRLPYYDYSQNGCYFVTICTQNRAMLFGSIENGKMYLSDIGKIIEDELLNLVEHYSNSVLESYVIMPNHLHFIWFNQNNTSLSNVVRRFKGNATSRYHSLMQERKQHYIPLWQRSFYEHIIRDDKDYEKIVEYIENNPLQWELDRFYSHF